MNTPIREVPLQDCLQERKERKGALETESISHVADKFGFVPHCHGESSLDKASLKNSGLAAINAAAGCEFLNKRDISGSTRGEDISVSQTIEAMQKDAFCLQRVLKGGDGVWSKMPRLLGEEVGRCILLVLSKRKEKDSGTTDYFFVVNRWMKIIYDSQESQRRYIDYDHIAVEDTEAVVQFFWNFNITEINRVWRVKIHRDHLPDGYFIGKVQEDGRAHKKAKKRREKQKRKKREEQRKQNQRDAEAPAIEKKAKSNAL